MPIKTDLPISDGVALGVLNKPFKLSFEPQQNNKIEESIEDLDFEIKAPNGREIPLGLFASKQEFEVDFSKFDIPNSETNSGAYTVFAYPVDENSNQDKKSFNLEINFNYDSSAPILPGNEVVLAPFVTRITDINGKKITVNQSWSEYIEDVNPERSYKPVTSDFDDVSLRIKTNNKRDLNNFLHFGDDNIRLVVNSKQDNETIPESPFSTIFKLYEPLPSDIEEKDFVYVVRELLPEVIEDVELIPYAQEEEEVTVLRNIESSQVDSPISKRITDFQNYNKLITSDNKLQNKIVDKFISGSEKPVELSVDYTKYDNFVNFSSAEKRLKNFKYKLQQIEGYTQESSSLVGVTSNEADILKFDNLIRDEKNSFDGYENYLYNISSSYVSSSMGEFQDASWPKTGSGTYADPFEPVSSSDASFTSWYGSVNNQSGQIYSASLYDTENPNRLVNLLPQYVREDVNNTYFLDFIDMVGQQFDELWLYTKALSDITDRQNDIDEGFSKELLFNLASSLGWSVNDGKDLLDLSRVGFGQKLEGSSYSLYTSGSLDSPNEGDISKEITKRLISSMPYILKSKGTLGSLKAILNCYGIPSSILRVREYGGLQKNNMKPTFEIGRKFTKALGFRGSQYVETPWEDDSVTSRKPETVELRFRATSGSNQVLVQKDNQWAIRLKNNNSNDNNGTVSFMLSGSSGYEEISSSLLPIYDGDYRSVMLKRSAIQTNLFPIPSFETSSIVNPPFLTGTPSAEFGQVLIASGSGVAKIGTKSLEHRNNHPVGGTSLNGGLFTTSYSYLYRNDNKNYPNLLASIADVSEGETYVFTAHAKVSASMEDSVCSIGLFELNSSGEVVNWGHEDEGADPGGIKFSEKVGINETEWKQVQVRKTIKFGETSGLGVRFDNNRAASKIYWDDVSVYKIDTATDDITKAYRFDLFVKQYDSGIDSIRLSSQASMVINSGSNAVSHSLNAAWSGSGDLYIGGNDTTPFGSKLTGSMMEFRLWTEPLDEDKFDVHVARPKSYIGNQETSSFTTLVRRLEFDDDKVLTNSASIRDTRPNQTTTQSGSANHFGSVNTFESVVDKTKTLIPNSGPNRRMATKIRIEDNYLSGSGANLSIDNRYDFSSNDTAPLDSPRLSVMFSPVDVINEDIISSFASLDFNQYLGDPRDDFTESYRGLKNVADVYFQKYTGNNNLFDYIRLIKYYDQSVFKQLRKVIPARAKVQMGTLIEGNIFERPKSPIQKNKPSQTQPYYSDTINVSNFDTEHEDSRSVVLPKGEYLNYIGTISNEELHEPALYNFAANDNFEDRNRYINGDVTFNGPKSVFSEPTGAYIDSNRLSLHNQEYKFHYTSSNDFDKSDKISVTKDKNLYTSKSLVSTDLDPEYQFILGLNRSFYEGVKNTKNTTTDGDSPVVVRVTAPSVAVPFDAGDSNLKVLEKNKGI